MVEAESRPSLGEGLGMNTRSNKPTVRYTGVVPGIDHSRRIPDGDYVHGLQDTGFAAAICDMIVE